MAEVYYVLRNIVSNGPQNLAPLEARIARINDEIGRNKYEIIRCKLSSEVDQTEGPYKSISELKKESSIFKSLTQSDKGRILKPTNIIFAVDLILGPAEETYDLDYANVLYHVMAGNSNKDRIDGIHFFDPIRVRIMKVTKIDNTTGAFNANIEVLNQNGCWLAKKEESSFFPIYWSKDILMHQTYDAYKRVKNKNNGSSIVKTPIGLSVKFVFKDGHLVTMYPVV